MHWGWPAMFWKPRIVCDICEVVVVRVILPTKWDMMTLDTSLMVELTAFVPNPSRKATFLHIASTMYMKGSNFEFAFYSRSHLGVIARDVVPQFMKNPHKLFARNSEERSPFRTSRTNWHQCVMKYILRWVLKPLSKSFFSSMSSVNQSYRKSCIAFPVYAWS